VTSPVLTPDEPAPEKRTQHEWRDQRAYAVFLSKALPPDAYWTAIDVGGSKSVMHGVLRKARGVKAGIPDLLVVHRGRTLWMECKSGTSLSPAQKTTRDALLANGHQWALVRRPEDLETALLAAGIPLRATMGEIRTRIAEQTERPEAKRKRHARPVQSTGRITVRQAHALGFWKP